MAHPCTSKYADFCRKNITIGGSLVEYKSLPIAIVDCVYSLRAKYREVTQPIVQRYADAFLEGNVLGENDSISLFIEHLNDIGCKAFADKVVLNHQVIGGVPKADVCYQLATFLQCLQIETVSDFRNYPHPELLKIVLQGVKGLGDAGTNYLFMLTGDVDKCKPDVHIHRSIQDACGRDVSNDDCQIIFTEVVAQLQSDYPGLTVRDLDYAVWSHYSSKRNHA